MEANGINIKLPIKMYVLDTGIPNIEKNSKQKPTLN
jgi:hypothetical protein